MKLVARRAVHGPNIHASRPVVLAVIDLEGLDHVPSTAIPGFVEGLLEAVPSLGVHRCSPGHVGGFVERLRAGTYMAHIVEHLTLELQCLAGQPAGYGRARRVVGMPHLPRHYRVVFAFACERVAEAALDLALEIVSTLAAGKPPAVDAGVARLRQLAQAAALGPSTRAIVDAAARRGIPALRLTAHASMFQLGWGAKQQRIQATLTSKTSHIAVGIASDKEMTKRLLREAGLPVPQGCTVATLEAALAAAHRIGGRVVLKPLCGNHGKGVTTGVCAVAGADAVQAAFDCALQFGRQVIVEQHIEGDDHRVLVVGKRVVAAARRVPPEVIGDGHSTVRQLVDAVNADPRRGEGHQNVLTRIRLDDAADHELRHQGLDAASVPAAGQAVRLRSNANLSTGGTAQDVTGQVHADTVRACVRAARKIGLDVAGVDLVCADIRLPLAAQGGAVIEINAAPGIRMHEHPSVGPGRRAGRAIVDSLFAADEDGRVPVIAIAGSRGKTATALLIGALLQQLGPVAGVATSAGITVAGRRIADGDCTGAAAAQTVFACPDVEFAVLETAAADVLAHGLGFDQCDVGIVLSLQDDPAACDGVGQDGLEKASDLAKARGLVASNARKAVVLNADDAACVQIAARVRRGTEIVYFGSDATRPALARHIASGGRAVFMQQGMLTWAAGNRHLPLTAAACLPGAPGAPGKCTPHDIAHAMAGWAAVLALGVAHARITAVLAGLGCDGGDEPTS